jgi:hypothetical protein
MLVRSINFRPRVLLANRLPTRGGDLHPNHEPFFTADFGESWFHCGKLSRDQASELFDRKAMGPQQCLRAAHRMTRKHSEGPTLFFGQFRHFESIRRTASGWEA